MKKTLLTSLLFLLLGSINAQKSSLEMKWDTVDSLELQGQVKSASEVTEEIIAIARERKDYSNLIKGKIFFYKFYQINHEDSNTFILKDINKTFRELPAPFSNIFLSYKAGFLNQYYSNHRWQISDRTEIDNPDPIALETWGAETLEDSISTYYLMSLNNQKKLFKTAAGEISELLDPSNLERKYRPTLFDLLAYRTIAYFSEPYNFRAPRPEEDFAFTSPALYGPTQHFQAIDFPSLKDSPEALILNLYQQLESLHKKEKNKAAQVYAELARLEYVDHNFQGEGQWELYSRALELLGKEYESEPVSALVQLVQARMLNEKASEEDDKGNLLYPNYRKMALALCDKVISEFPNTDSTQDAFRLKSTITAVDIRSVHEEVLPADTPGLLYVSYRSLDSLRLRIFKLPRNLLKDVQYLQRDSLVKAWVQKQALIDQHFDLPASEDYNPHSTELPLPGLELGSYLLHLSGTTPAGKAGFSYSTLDISDLVLRKTFFDRKTAYQVFNRTSGMPAGALEVSLTDKKKQVLRQFTTGDNGKFEIEAAAVNAAGIRITKGKDSLFTDFSKYYWQRDDGNQPPQAKTMLYLDRAIYRPGQTVHFKGVLLQYVNGKTSTVPGEYVEVFVKDPNYQVVDSLRLKTNKYGSFSGEFDLPSTGITGRFQIFTEEDSETAFWNRINEEGDYSDGSNYFTVEEYKRPTFEISFDTIAKAFQLGDTVQVSGKAASFMGAALASAKVRYEVTRQEMIFSWWGRRSGESVVVKTDSVMTAEDGHFLIEFPAIPARKDLGKQDLVYSYNIKTSVTDISGETREGSTSVKIGKKNLLLDLVLEKSVNKQDSLVPKIKATNLNDKMVKMEGSLKIYKLQGPDKIMKQRLWDAPEFHLIAKEKFDELYPELAYDSLPSPENWPKGALVYQSDFKSEGGFAPEISVAELRSGKYVMEVEVTNEDNEARARAIFDIVDPEDTYLPDNQRLQASLQNRDFFKDKRISLLLQTAYNELPVQVSVYDQQEIVFEDLLNLNGRKELSIPIKDTDASELRIEVKAVKNNSFLEQRLSVPLNRPRNTLSITTETFRSKIEPGIEETWSFKVADTSSTVPDAEILASMYDASLDQFTTAEWDTSTGFARTRYNFPWSDSRQINNTISQDDNFPYHSYYREYKRRFDQLHSFGFVFSQPRSYVYSNYLRQLKNNRMPSILEGNTLGKVTDPRGNPLPGVNILLEGTGKGTQTDFNGEFALDTDKGDILLFSYLGYETASYTVGDLKEIFIVLEESNQSLDEVVEFGEIVEEVEEVALMQLDSAPPPAERLAGQVAGVSLQTRSKGQVLEIRGSASLTGDTPLFIVDGKIVTEVEIPVDDILSSETLTGAEATALYGSRAANGVVIITTKQSLASLQQVEARKDLDETAFFFPDLQLSEDGRVSFSFTSPEALTRWKLRLLGHTTDWTTGTYTGTVITQKELSVQPNAPRFLREGDNIIFTAKLSNLTDKPMIGTVILQLFDALNGNQIDTLIGNTDSLKNFQIKASGSEAVSWQLQVPQGLKAVTYKVLAKAGDFSDGEENQLPVLSNRMQVQESLPMFVRAGESETYVFENLKENQSSTLEHESFSIEYTSNPAWYAVQSLPYLIEFEHECSEQIFARLYANSLASHIINSQPKLKEVFEQWRKDSSLVSQLEKKEGLSNQLLSETPWLREALSETERKQAIAELFKLEKLARDQQEILSKLGRMQNPTGAFPWFSGGDDNLFITRHIIAGLGHLKQLGVALESSDIAEKGLAFLDKAALARAKQITDTTALRSFYTDLSNLHYLYARSFFSEEVPATEELGKLISKMVAAEKEEWLQRDLYGKALSMMVLSRYGEKETAKTIMNSLLESAVRSEDYGMYWKENTSGWHWYRAPIETQALLIEAFAEVGGASEAIEEMKIWLLQNKRSTHWPTTKSSTEAIYALLLQGADWLQTSSDTGILLGGEPIPEEKLAATEKEAGTGYFKVKWQGEEVDRSFAEISVTNNNQSPGYGAAYWQYSEELDKIKVHSTSPLNIEKELYLNLATASGNTLKQITPETALKTGDLVTVRLVVRATFDMDYVHLEDMRASGFEPTDVLSTYRQQDGAYYYQSTKDAATHFFFDSLRKGTYVLEYTVRANNSGHFSNGITTIQSMYAPEFAGHTKGVKVRIE